MLTLDHDDMRPLIEQIATGLITLIENGSLPTGSRLPSIRAFAAMHAVSTFTVVEAYDRLVARGVLTARGQLGFFVAGPVLAALAPHPARSRSELDSEWYIQRIFENRDMVMKPGCGWLPQDWMFEDGLRRAMRRIATEATLSGYGDPMGFAELRALIARQLGRSRHIWTTPDHVLMTHGSSQALDLTARTLVNPGDTVLVDDPGYPNLMRMLRLHGARLIGIPRTPDGYDMQALAQAIRDHRPVAMFTQPRLQSPTGSRADTSQLHQLLQLAEQAGMWIVENDIYADLEEEAQPELGSLDQLRRVIVVGSYSKTISPNIRVGFVLANRSVIDQLLQLKMRAGLTSSEVMERVVHAVLLDGRWRKHLKTLQQRLHEAHLDVEERLRRLGFQIFSPAREGLYQWARHPLIPDSVDLVEDAMQHQIMLGPGQLFRVEPGVTDWIRMNVAFSRDERLWDYLERVIAAKGPASLTA